MGHGYKYVDMNYKKQTYLICSMCAQNSTHFNNVIQKGKYPIDVHYSLPIAKSIFALIHWNRTIKALMFTWSTHCINVDMSCDQ